MGPELWNGRIAAGASDAVSSRRTSCGTSTINNTNEEESANSRQVCANTPGISVRHPVAGRKQDATAVHRTPAAINWQSSRVVQPNPPAPVYIMPSLETRVCARLGWVIWALAVAATVGCSWIRDSDGNIEQFTAVSHGEYDRACYVGILNASWCAMFQVFRVMQVSATLLCSAVMVGFTIAPFYRRVRWFTGGYAGGALFLVYTLLQLVVVVLAAKLKEGYRDAFSTGGDFTVDLRYEYGGSFSIATVASCLGLIEGLFLLVLAGWAPRIAGCIRRCTANAGLSAMIPFMGGAWV